MFPGSPILFSFLFLFGHGNEILWFRAQIHSSSTNYKTILVGPKSKSQHATSQFQLANLQKCLNYWLIFEVFRNLQSLWALVRLWQLLTASTIILLLGKIDGSNQILEFCTVKVGSTTSPNFFHDLFDLCGSSQYQSVLQPDRPMSVRISRFLTPQMPHNS